MSSQSKENVNIDAKEEKKRRLAEELRENLKKRKKQTQSKK